MSARPDTADEQVSEETLGAHAKRVLKARVTRALGRVLRRNIAVLQRMLARVDPDPEPDHRSRASHMRRGESRDIEPAAAAERPRPRRLRALLVNALVLLLGAMAGGALAYELLAKLLDRRTTEAQKFETSLLKQNKSAAANRKKLEETEAKLAELAKKPSEAEAALARAEKELADERTRRNEAEKQLKAFAEKQKKLGEAVRILEAVRGPDASAARPSAEGARSSISPASYPRNARAPKSGDCTVASTSLSDLKDCVREFNR